MSAFFNVARADAVGAVQRPLPIYKDRFDRVQLWVDGPLDPRALAKLSQCCGKDVLYHPVRVRFQPIWQYELTLLQPTQKCWPALSEVLGAGINVQFSYVEVARDIIFESAKRARRAEKVFWALAALVYGRASTATNCAPDGTAFDGTYLYAPKAGPINLATYANRPSKPRHKHEGQPCLHIEIRLNNSPALEKAGFVTCADFEAIDFDAFYAQKLRFYEPPPTKAIFGRMLTNLADRRLTEAALRKRVDQIANQPAFQLNGKFSMHQLLTENPILKRKLTTMTFADFTEMNDSDTAVRKLNRILGLAI